MREITELEELRRKEFAIKCREVRLWMASHPGSTEFEIRRACGSRIDFCLGKMLGMEIIKLIRTIESDGRRVTRWYVVPQ